MVLDPIPQILPVHFFGARPQPPTSPWRFSTGDSSEERFEFWRWVCLCAGVRVRVCVHWCFVCFGCSAGDSSEVKFEFRVWCVCVYVCVRKLLIKNVRKLSTKNVCCGCSTGDLLDVRFKFWRWALCVFVCVCVCTCVCLHWFFVCCGCSAGDLSEVGSEFRTWCAYMCVCVNWFFFGVLWVQHWRFIRSQVRIPGVVASVTARCSRASPLKRCVAAVLQLWQSVLQL